MALEHAYVLLISKTESGTAPRLGKNIRAVYGNVEDAIQAYRSTVMEGEESERDEREIRAGKPVPYYGKDHEYVMAKAPEPDTFAQKVALANTQLEADPGVLAAMMKFHNPDFKGGPWTGMTQAQAKASAATEAKRAVVAAQEAEAAAAMKAGGRRRKTLRRRK